MANKLNLFTLVYIAVACGHGKGVGQLERLLSKEGHKDSAEVPPPMPHEGVSPCAPPPEWQVSLCVDAPPLAGKTYSRSNRSAADCEKGLKSGVEMSCRDTLEFRADGTVDYLIGGGDIIERTCFHQQGGCVAIGDFKRGDYNTLPDRSFSLSKEGHSLTDNVRQVVYMLDATSTCQQQRTALDAAISELSVCSTRSDCSYKGVHPQFGCFLVFNKNRPTAAVEEMIDSYSTGACWNGSTTDCMNVNDNMLKCTANKCLLEP